MRHAGKIGHANPSMQIAAHRQSQFARRADKLLRFHDFSQRDRLTIYIGHLDANRGFAGNPLDQNGFSLQRKTQIFRQSNNPAVLDSRFRLEFKRCDYRPRIDLRHAPLHVEFEAFFLNGTRAIFQFFFVQFLRTCAFAQQTDRRQFVIRVSFGNLRFRCLLRGFLRLLLIEHQNRRFVGLAVAVVLVLVALFLPLENVTFIGKMDGLRRFIWRCGLAHRPAALKTVGFHSPPHPFLLAARPPIVPPCLRLLQNA